MKENPILHNKFVALRLVAGCVILGCLYCGTFGFTTHLDGVALFVDCIISIVAFAICGTLLWNILSFGIFKGSHLSTKLLHHAIYALAIVIVILGLETVTLHLFEPMYESEFLRSIPARALFILLLYGLYFMTFEYHYSLEQQEDDDCDDPDSEAEDEPVEADVAIHDEIPKLDHITVKIGQKIKLIHVDELICVKAEDDYVSLVTAEGKWLRYDTMKNMEASLPTDNFARIHRSYIVNISKIVKIERYGQKQQLQLSNGVTLRISPNGYKILKEKLNL